MVKCQQRALSCRELQSLFINRIRGSQQIYSIQSCGKLNMWVDRATLGCRRWQAQSIMLSCRVHLTKRGTWGQDRCVHLDFRFGPTHKDYFNLSLSLVLWGVLASTAGSTNSIRLVSFNYFKGITLNWKGWWKQRLQQGAVLKSTKCVYFSNVSGRC